MTYEDLKEPDSNKACGSGFVLCNKANPANSICVPEVSGLNSCPITDLKVVNALTKTEMTDAQATKSDEEADYY